MSWLSKVLEEAKETIDGSFIREFLENVLKQMFDGIEEEFPLEILFIKGLKIKMRFDIVKTREEKSGGLDFMWISLSTGVIRGSLSVSK